MRIPIPDVLSKEVLSQVSNSGGRNSCKRKRPKTDIRISEVSIM